MPIAARTSKFPLAEPTKITQHQLFACLVPKTFLNNRLSRLGGTKCKVNPLDSRGMQLGTGILLALFVNDCNRFWTCQRNLRSLAKKRDLAAN